MGILTYYRINRVVIIIIVVIRLFSIIMTSTSRVVAASMLPARPAQHFPPLTPNKHSAPRRAVAPGASL